MIYVAGPFFNEEQRKTITKIEELFDKKEVEYFSPRKHSEGMIPKGEDRKNPDMWKPVYDLNIKGVEDSNLVLALLSFEMPEGLSTAIVADKVRYESTATLRDSQFVRPLPEFPDSGTIFEMGFANGIGTPVLGFHPTKKLSDLNLMLTHGCTGLVHGWTALEVFFEECEGDDIHYNFGICEKWAPQQGAK